MGMGIGGGGYGYGGSYQGGYGQPMRGGFRDMRGGMRGRGFGPMNPMLMRGGFNPGKARFVQPLCQLSDIHYFLIHSLNQLLGIKK